MAAFVWAPAAPIQHHRDCPSVYGSNEAVLGPFAAPLSEREAAIVERFQTLATAQGFSVERRESDNSNGALLFVARRSEVSV